MPPWPPGARSPSYVGEQERRLSAAERATLLAWARAGGKVDGPARKPLPEQARRRSRPESRSSRSACLPRTGPAPRRGVTDDYRCFLLDPKRSGDSFVTSARIEPGAAKVVHHVILFRVARGQVADAKRLDSGAAGPGWNCFGGTGLPSGDGSGSIQDSLNDANWVAAWAPGWGGNRLPQGTGVPLARGQPDRDAGALQPAERPDSRSLARGAHRRSRRREAHSFADDAPSRTGRAPLRPGRARASLQPQRGALRSHGQVRVPGGVRAGRAPDPLPRKRREPARGARSPPATGA